MDERIADRIHRAIDEKIFPACAVGVIDAEGKRAIEAFGTHTYDAGSARLTADHLFDVASITKSIPGACALMWLVDQGQLSLDHRLVDFVPGFGNGPDKPAVTIRHLLTYTLNLEVPAMSSLKMLPPEELIRFIIEAPLREPPGSSFFYTNSTAFFFGFIVRKITGKTLDQFADEIFFGPLGMARTTFHPERFNKEAIVPTEIDPWRGGLVRGVVHDESTYILKDRYIGGTAGLFSTAADLLTFARMLLLGGAHAGGRLFSQEMVRQMHTNQVSHIGASAGLGWELGDPNRMGAFAPEMFGKTGFTGCIVLINPEKQKALVILSNRVHPKRPNDSGAGINAVRRDVANIVFAG